jgi:hypothetical protein
MGLKKPKEKKIEEDKKEKSEMDDKEEPSSPKKKKGEKKKPFRETDLGVKISDVIPCISDDPKTKLREQTLNWTSKESE